MTAQQAVGSVADISDDELLRRAIKTARPHSHRKGPFPRWAAVMDTFMLGSGYSRQLCARFGFDPDETVNR
jgi:hypothetical protein